MRHTNVKQNCLLTTGSVQDCGYDGARLCDDRRDCTLLVWLCDCAPTVCENCGHLSTLFGAALLPASLRLWDESCQVSAHCCWKPQGSSTQNYFDAMELVCQNFFPAKIIPV